MENDALDPTSLIQALAERGDVVAIMLVLVCGALIAWIKSGGAVALFGASSPKTADIGLTNAVTSMSEKVDQIDQRLTRVERDFEHLPDNEDYQTLQLAIARMDEKMIAISDALTATNRGLTRIEGIILTIATKGNSDG